ncbi:Bug family tripartite tricarboxylate transporter substrate binding protein [Pontivivens nitratireducens]|uniref:Bug family tripartite tricarboxylate transporter substrate binding protein n=1 Tax=Pontivivens nitratireducens TaxID=2758038 RepID=UPI00163B09A4|nr:tripartite tricarboxylate transporter substrate-binding protein [Pontibrevibacter nitratireducens]
MTLFNKIAAVALSATVLASPALAEFPERNIENIYPWAPGATMAASQVIADAMGDELGVNISVVSTPGAGGVKAFETAMSRPADGYTIFDGYVAPLVLQPMQGNADWSYTDFTPLWSATSNAFAIAVRADEDRFEDLPALLDYAAQNPGDLRYSPGNAGALPHMVVAKVMQNSDAVAQLVPYPEIDNAVRDLRSGILDFIVINPGVYTVNKDSVKILGVLSTLERSSETYGGAPLIGSFGLDMGMTDLSPMGWNWWLVRSDTPEGVVATLREAMGTVMNDEETQNRLLEMGYVPTLFSPEQYEEIVGPVAEQLQGGIDAIAWEKEQLDNM